MDRVGLNVEKWQLNVKNKKYEICDSYPGSLIVPSSVSNIVLLQIAQFRKLLRIPVLAFKHPRKNSTLFRASQIFPILFQDLAFVGMQVSEDDKVLIAEMLKSSEGCPSLVFLEAGDELPISIQYSGEVPYPNTSFVFLKSKTVEVGCSRK